jgi:glucokinase
VPTAGRAGAGAGGGDALFARLAGLVDEVLGGAGGGALEPVVCGVGCGGPMTAGGEEVSPLNIAAWRDFPLRRRLAEHTGLPTFVDNDAKALALGEGWRGAAAGVPDYVGMVVSTGVGGGIVLDGRLLEGARGNAGHIGHIVVVPGGRRCVCGARGCLEAEASGTAIAAMTGRSAAEAGPDVVARTGRLVGLAVGSVANLLDLRLAVVAGSVALGFGAPFFVAAQAELDATAQLSFSRGAIVRPAGLGDLGPLVGAAAVGWRGAGRQVLAGSG